ncbi:dephospho-CoA kinase [uncultured Polaribacter sp.]|uniref:dephospho-CoA kinase n=1 Tax=uncultured Polaribacter sp. TaxID=174711 RepID=UPI0026123651|nr:dephospho-CoA kinase [uncultured Polaribacter sp.]
MVVGLTGGIGSGKTTVAKLFQKFDTVAVYIADLEAKKLMNASKVIKNQIIAEFGAASYKKNQLNRTYLSSLVFNNKKKLQILNSIVHPAVKRDFRNFVVAHKDKSYIIYESAILFESNSQHQFDFVITVFTHLEERISRVIKRDHTTKEEVLKRIHNQWKEDKKLLFSNYIIENNTLRNTENQVKKIHNILTKKATHFL